ncbi:hypothetical protein ILUMI_17297, partial [Ignelater luminosus]
EDGGGLTDNLSGSQLRAPEEVILFNNDRIRNFSSIGDPNTALSSLPRKNDNIEVMVPLPMDLCKNAKSIKGDLESTGRW